MSGMGLSVGGACIGRRRGVGVGVVVASNASGLAAEQSVQLGTHGVLGGFANLMTGAALVERLLTGSDVLRAGGASHGGGDQGGKGKRSEERTSDHLSLTFEAGGMLASGRG